VPMNDKQLKKLQKFNKDGTPRKPRKRAREETGEVPTATRFKPDWVAEKEKEKENLPDQKDETSLPQEEQKE
jgi:hypothetical protein